MQVHDKLLLIKLDLLESDLNEIIVKQQPHIGNIWVKLLEFSESILNLTDAIRTLSENQKNANLHKYEVCNFRFGGNKQNMRNMICDGLLSLERNPEKNAESIAAYQSIYLILKQYDK
jgi:hypothetical protein